MVDSSLALIIGSQVLFYIACILGILAMRRRLNRSSESSNSSRSTMREALLEQGEMPAHRVEAAARQADEGTRVCSTCKFANFKRSRHCALCGECLVRTFDTLYAEKPSDGGSGQGHSEQTVKCFGNVWRPQKQDWTQQVGSFSFLSDKMPRSRLSRMISDKSVYNRAMYMWNGEVLSTSTLD
ncbi:hypothetical protein PINS_up015578 [Pythium insidiosum]|nr:hypothetical protein PINS_up015578 [Pythium insidiosum]